MSCMSLTLNSRHILIRKWELRHFPVWFHLLEIQGFINELQTQKFCTQKKSGFKSFSCILHIIKKTKRWVFTPPIGKSWQIHWFSLEILPVFQGMIFRKFSDADPMPYVRKGFILMEMLVGQADMDESTTVSKPARKVAFSHWGLLTHICVTILSFGG